jgi:SAM-dependent methyltransferase
MDLEIEGLPEGLASSGAVEIARALGILDGGRVLDVGTGKGDLISTLAVLLDDFSSFTGVDLDQEKLDKAMDRLEGLPARLLVMDAGEMTFEDGSFDTVCISYSLHHLERPGDVLAEMVRVLRPGGTFILQEMYSDGEQSPAQVTDMLSHHWDSRIDTLLGKFHRETYTRDEIRNAVDGLHLTDVEFFETTRNVHCLVCEDRSKCEDPMDPEMVGSAIEDIEENLKRLEQFSKEQEGEGLAEEGRGLIERVRETGSHPASTMFVIGHK